MSSMKSFKSRLSQKRGNSQSKINLSLASESFNAQYNPRNLFISQPLIQFTLRKQNDQIIIPPCTIQISNNTGARIFFHLVCSHEDYFSITPKKYILQNGNSLQITIKLIEITYVRMQDYESAKFQLSWGKITEEEIANKIIPQLTEAKVLDCQIANKDIVNQVLAKKTYPNMDYLGVGGQKSKNILENSHLFNASKRGREEFVRSGLDASDLRMYEEQPSLLRTNVIIAVAIVSFIIGFIGG